MAKSGSYAVSLYYPKCHSKGFTGGGIFQVRKKLIIVEVQTRYPTVLCLPPPLSWLEREDAALAG